MTNSPSLSTAVCLMNLFCGYLTILSSLPGNIEGFDARHASSLSYYRLVIAGNDGTLCIWDLSTVSFSTDSPKLLYRTGKKSYHTSGIFCMDTTANTAATSCNSNWNINADNNAMICTGSKDKSVIVTRR